MNELFRQILVLPEQGSSVAAEVDAFHYVVITITMLGAVAVALTVAYFLFRYRASAVQEAATAPDPDPHHSPGGVPIWLEVFAFGGLLALFIALWVVGFRQYVHLQTPPAAAIDVYVTGKQWMWSFAYPGGGGTNEVLYVPVGRPVRLLMTSRDVIHSLFVPAFRVKQDVVPGQLTVMWFQAEREGEYPILCTEYCGLSHSTMRGRVIAVAPGEFDRLTRQAAGGADMVRRGAQVALDRGCARCHSVDGTPDLGPTWAGLYRSRVRLASGEVVVADEAYLTRSMMDPLAEVHIGFAPVMPAFVGQLSATETAALVEYIRSLRGER